MKDLKEAISIITVCSVFLCLLLGFWVIRSHFEAKTYTELTGRTVTTWQAMWIELRVIEPAK